MLAAPPQVTITLAEYPFGLQCNRSGVCTPERFPGQRDLLSYPAWNRLMQEDPFNNRPIRGSSNHRAHRYSYSQPYHRSTWHGKVVMQDSGVTNEWAAAPLADREVDLPYTSLAGFSGPAAAFFRPGRRSCASRNGARVFTFQPTHPLGPTGLRV